MKIAVIGATGRTGRPLVVELLRRGHAVTALARRPEALDVAALQAQAAEGATGPVGTLQVVPGDSRDGAALERLLAGVDAVVSALGPTAKEADLHTETARALLTAMPAAGVRRFVGVSGAGIDVPDDRKSPSAKLISKLIQTLGGAAVQDKPAEYRVYAGSDLDWTLVRPPRLVDGTATGRVEHDAHRSTRSTKIVRADLAAFLADCVEGGSYVRRAPFVASA